MTYVPTFYQNSFSRSVIAIYPIYSNAVYRKVDWSIGDFLIMAFMLTVYSAAINFALYRLYGSKQSLIIFVIGLLFFLLWAELAVGIFNSPFAGS